MAPLQPPPCLCFYLKKEAEDSVSGFRNAGQAAALRSARAFKRVVFALLSSATLYGCAVGTTPYQSEGITGGYGERHVDGETWQVYFHGNGLTYFETAETKWFYRCAELALSKGFDGFSIVSTYELVGDQYNPDVNGTITLIRKPFAPVPGKIFDARLVESTLQDYVTGKKCKSDRDCRDDWHELTKNEIFLRMTVFNISGHVIGLPFEDGIHQLASGYGAVAVEYPQEAKHWLLKIVSDNCTYDYEMPRDLDDRPWNAFGYGNGSVPVQIAPDFSLHIVAPHPDPWGTETTVLTTKEWRAPIVPKKICR